MMTEGRVGLSYHFGDRDELSTASGSHDEDTSTRSGAVNLCVWSAIVSGRSDVRNTDDLCLVI